MKLNDTEKAIIEAYRDGAELDIWFHKEPDIDDAIQKVNKFGKVTNFKDVTSEKDSVSFVSVERDDDNLEITAIVRARRTTDYYFQDVGE